MTTLTLQKIKSYTGIVRVTQAKPTVTVDDDTAAKLLATGYFAVASKEAGDKTEATVAEGEAVDFEALAAMTKQALTAYAEEHGIDLGKSKTKADILMVISEFYGGCDTMIDLQRR